MRADSYAVPVPTSVAAGQWVDVSGMEKGLVTLVGSFTATVQFQMAVGGDTANPLSLGGALTAPGQVALPGSGQIKVRANVTAFTSGTPSASVTGMVP